MHLYILLFLMFIFLSSCKGQTNAGPPTDNTASETKAVDTSYGPTTMVRNTRRDRKGTMLIAAAMGGVFRYDGRSFTNITNKSISDGFWNVLEDRHGNLWFASTYSGAYYYDGTSFRKFSSIDGFSNADVTTIMEDRTGRFWFGTRGEAFSYDGKTFTVFKNKEGKSFKNVWSIIEDKKGNIWLGGTDGLWRYDGSKCTNITQDTIVCIYEDKKGNIWTGSPTANKGTLSRYDEKSLSDEKPVVTKIKVEAEGQAKAVLGISEAADGSIWLGTFNGVRRYDGYTVTDFKDKEVQK